MAISYQQEDTLAGCGAIQACSGMAPAGTADAIQATDGGTAGTTELACDVAAASSEGCFMAEIPVADSTSLDAGTLTMRINVTGAQMNLTWEEVYVCRLNSACSSQETLGSVTGMGVDISGGGVFSQNVTLSAAAAHNAGDLIYIVCTFANSHSMASRSVNITPDQLIDTPFTQSGTTFSETLTEGVVASDSQGETATLVEAVVDAVRATDSQQAAATMRETVDEVVAPSDAVSETLTTPGGGVGVTRVVRLPARSRVVKPTPWNVTPRAVAPEWRWVWESLVVALPLWEAAGDTVRDVGDGHDGTFQGTAESNFPFWDTDIGGRVIRALASGTSGSFSYIQIPDANSGWLPTDAITIVGRRRKLDTTARRARGFGLDTVAGTGTARCAAHWPWSDGVVYWDFGGNSGNARLSVSGLTFTDMDTWAFVADASGDGNGMEIWQNGELKASQAAANPGRTTSSLGFRLNSGSNAEDTDPVKWSVFYVFDRALAPSQIQQLNRDPFGPFRPQRLVAWQTAAAAAQVFSETLTESALVTDDVDSRQTFSISVTEGISASDEPDSVATLVEALSEASDVSDQLDAALTLTERLTEGVKVTDQLAVALRMAERLAESADVSDVLDATATMVERVTEGAVVSDVVDATATMVEAIAESVDASDVVSESIGVTIAEVLTEGVEASDTVDARQTFAEQLTAAVRVTDLLGVTQTMVEALSEAVLASDVLSHTIGGVIAETLTESVDVSDQVVSAATMVEALTSGVTADDQLRVAHTIAEALTEGVSASEVTTATQTMAETVVEAARVADTVESRQTMVEALLAAVVVADAVDADATMVETLTESTAVTDVLTEALRAVISEGVQAADQLDDVLTMAVRLEEATSVTDTLGVAHTMVEQLTEAVAASDEVSLPAKAFALLAAIEALARISGAVDAEALVTAAVESAPLAGGAVDADAGVSGETDAESSVDGELGTN